MTNILCKNLRFCKVTNRGDQYTLQKSTILQSNERIIGDFTFYIDFDWPWPLTLTLDLDIDRHLFCKKKLQKPNVVTWRDAKRRLAYDKWNHLPIGISSRNNLQPTRNTYYFRFKSYGLLCDFHKVVILTLTVIRFSKF